MEIYTLAAVILGMSALASVFNARLLKLPETIGLMATGLLVSGAFLLFGLALRKPDVDASERQHLDIFWEGIDHILNAVLFTLMGMVLLGLSGSFEFRFLVAGLLAIPAILLARLTSVSLPLPLTKLRYGNPKTTIAMLTWGGLRGGISIALALSLSGELSRDLILHMTYIVVAFSILGQGMTISPLVNKLIPQTDPPQ